MELHRSPISACSSKFQLSKFRGRLMGAQLTRFWFTFPERMFLPLSLLSRWFFFFLENEVKNILERINLDRVALCPAMLSYSTLYVDLRRCCSPLLDNPCWANIRVPILDQWYIVSLSLPLNWVSLIRMNKFNILNSYDTKIIYESWKNSGYFIRRNEKTRYE